MRQSPNTRAEEAAHIVKQVESLGIAIHPSSRLMQMKKVLEHGYIEFDNPKFPIAMESIRDMYQIRLILDESNSHRSNLLFQDSLKKLLRDAALPHKGNSNTPGRDTQFEMYLGAIAERGGLTPTEYAEPDIVCIVNENKFGIAAKRLKGIKRLKKRVKKGAKQICESKMPGIIALDLTLAQNPTNQPITSSIQSQFSHVISEAKNRQLLKDHEHDIYKWFADSGVRALLIFEFMFRVNPDNGSWIHNGMMCWFPTTHGIRKDELELAAFQKGFLKGVPDLL